MPSQFNSLTFDYFVHHSTFSMPAFVLSLWVDGNLINGASFSYRVCFQKCGCCLTEEVKDFMRSFLIML